MIYINDKNGRVSYSHEIVDVVCRDDDKSNICVVNAFKKSFFSSKVRINNGAKLCLTYFNNCTIETENNDKKDDIPTIRMMDKIPSPWEVPSIFVDTPVNLVGDVRSWFNRLQIDPSEKLYLNEAYYLKRCFDKCFINGKPVDQLIRESGYDPDSEDFYSEYVDRVLANSFDMKLEKPEEEPKSKKKGIPTIRYFD